MALLEREIKHNSESEMVIITYVLHGDSYVLKKNKVQLFCKVDKQNSLHVPYLYMCDVVQVNFIQ